MVDCGIPSRLAAALPPVDSANLTASVLNSSVYRRYGTDSFFPISPSVHQKVTNILMYVKPGQGQGTTYIRMGRGFVYPTMVLDWASRQALAWRRSISLAADAAVEALAEAIARHGVPEIMNTDQGSEFTFLAGRLTGRPSTPQLR